jgi:hypothetical protein
MRVGNPEGGTNRVWKPGLVDPRARVAVGAEEPHEGSRSRAGLRRGCSGKALEGDRSPWKLLTFPASALECVENRVVVETARRVPRTE